MQIETKKMDEIMTVHGMATLVFFIRCKLVRVNGTFFSNNMAHLCQQIGTSTSTWKRMLPRLKQEGLVEQATTNGCTKTIFKRAIPRNQKRLSTLIVWEGMTDQQIRDSIYKLITDERLRRQDHIVKTREDDEKFRGASSGVTIQQWKAHKKKMRKLKPNATGINYRKVVMSDRKAGAALGITRETYNRAKQRNRMSGLVVAQTIRRRRPVYAFEVEPPEGWFVYRNTMQKMYCEYGRDSIYYKHYQAIAKQLRCSFGSAYPIPLPPSELSSVRILNQ